ncbi:hypothetical protein Pan241w_32120 [Gimesia alba]|uniref:Uncharacterized protein n=1 Tax=Gimesia alba TaxID=2527973 RepID=A0A517RGX7_9PLAN|nr:hypothetical protein [Gimesia alba]QDT43115.1 hypothetical protein Pan241w_32120 [Gimesia alba]
MTSLIITCITICVLLLIGLTSGIWLAIRARNMQYWLPAYFVRKKIDETITFSPAQPRHIFIAVCDHFEPEWGNPVKSEALARIDRWCEEYPARFSQFSDSRGQVPQHTFFFPQDQYAPEYLDRLAALCKQGFGDVDVHLHHDNDTAEGLRQKMNEFRQTLFDRHGLLRKDPQTGEIVYGFIHGNWALCNSRPDRRWCGVENEIDILLETGCYADLTMPSAPSDTQTQIINSIYYAKDIPGQCKSHNQGTLASVGHSPEEDSLLMIQGPLRLDWSKRKWGFLPRIENSDLHGGRPATLNRFQHWLAADVHVTGRPDWTFIKLHTHGAKPRNIDTLLGPETEAFHAALRDEAKQHPEWKYYYVSAWEMAALIHQAEQGATAPDFEAIHAGQSHVSGVLI